MFCLSVIVKVVCTVFRNFIRKYFALKNFIRYTAVRHSGGIRVRNLR